MRMAPEEGRQENTRQPEFLTSQDVAATLVANLSVRWDKVASVRFRAVCLQVEVAAGLGSWALQVYKRDVQDTQQEGTDTEH